ncbi:hypothetical protein GLAREA_02847 [Glarea lozoyensis ATCC 20868]|uniref:5'-3' DNA helicase ZGRF1-like N-terminal domain-containing protein n=1 Tax=Glarea lozoyensis (strain ATCC 20868 / MF5171) TaxID=1116229 RepID=S3DK68_GLAL2|nr:uncharacterized protein GLAREA_02847 [Glarea lozoyensis ATCC 20868]EPE26933.1 hypothetical protein GLAREA_02847 [Glarea lozoyensis ATCC 20868]
MSESFDVPRSQNTAPVFEFKCLYTADLRRKQKRWRDGRLKYHSFNKRVMVYDERSNFVGDVHWREDHELCDGDELQLERGGILVQVEEKLETHNQDLSELVDKPRKEKEARAAARTANGSPGSFGKTQNFGTPAHTAMPKSLNRLLTPSGHHGRAQIPITSPFEDRRNIESVTLPIHEEQRPSKRRKCHEPQDSKSGFAQNLTGAMLNLTSSKPSSTPTIRYDTFKPKFSVPQQQVAAIDLTLDDDTGMPGRHEELPQRRDKTAKTQARPHKSRQNKSASEQSGYASNLTGVMLSLSRPPPSTALRPIGVSRGGKMNDSQFDENSMSREEGQGEGDAGSSVPETSLVNRNPLGTLHRKDNSSNNSTHPRKTLKPRSSSPPAIAIPDDSANIRRVVKSIAKSVSAPSLDGAAKTTPLALNVGANLFVGAEGNGSIDSRKSRPLFTAAKDAKMPDHKVSKPSNSLGSLAGENKSRLVKARAEINQQPREGGSSSEVPHMRSSVQERHKSSAIPTTSSSSLRNIRPTGKERTPEYDATDPFEVGPKPNKNTSESSLMATSESDKPVPTLRIRSRQPKKMMMFMSRPGPPISTRKSPSRDITNHRAGHSVATRDPVQSQATVELDSLIQRQQERIQSRLSKSRSRPSIDREDLTSHITDHGIAQNTSKTTSAVLSKSSSSKRTPAHTSVQGSIDPPTVSSSVLPEIEARSLKSQPPESDLVSGTSRLGSVSMNIPSSTGTFGEDVHVVSRTPSAQDNKEAVANLSKALSSVVEMALPAGTRGAPQPIDMPQDTIMTTSVPEDSYIPVNRISDDRSTTSIQSKDGSISTRDDRFPVKVSGFGSSEIPSNPRHAFSCGQNNEQPILDTTMEKGRAPQNQHSSKEETTCGKLPHENNIAPPHIEEEHREVIKSTSPKSTLPDVEMLVEDPSDEQSAHVTIQSPENQTFASAKEVSGVHESTTAHTESSLQPCTVRTASNFGSRWQGSDNSNNSDFALSITTVNQSKFKLSKPVPRAQPLGPPPARLSSKPADVADDNGMPVTSTGPWSREAFDLFGSWKPISGHKNGT